MEEERCFNNWDLDAVVRLGCRRRLSPPRQQPNPFPSFLLPQPPPPPQPQKEKPVVVPAPEPPAKEPEADAGWRFPDFCAGGGQDGDEFIRALLAAHPPPPQPQPLPQPTPTPPPPQQQQPPPSAAVTAVDVPPPMARAAPARAQPSGRQVPGSVPRSKRRKNQVRKVVCHVPADGSSSDVWAWRKYGQKPIKGSPYPRGYYRCSSSKGCAARKQVERSRADPNTFILTYTGEHNHAAPTHRNSLAGTTRHKFPSPAPPPPSVVVGGSGSGDAQQQQQHQHPSPSPTSTSTAGLSPTTPLRTPSMDEEEEEEDELLVEDMEIAGEDELLFLNADAGNSGMPLEPMSSLFDVVDEPFLISAWVTDTTCAGEPATGAAGAGS